MKLDLRNDEGRFEKWLDNAQHFGIKSLNKTNSDLLIRHIVDMREGRNVSKGRLGKRGCSTLNTRIIRLRVLFRRFEDDGIKNIAHKLVKGDMNEDKLHITFNKIDKSMGEYIKDFKTYWHWYMRVNRKLYNETAGKKGAVIPDITEELSKPREENTFVYFKFDEFRDKMLQYLNPDEQTMLLFMFDTLIRSPGELSNIQVRDLHDDYERLTIRGEISKTYERNIQLLLCSDSLREHIKRNKLKSDDYLFKFDPSNINKKLKKVANQSFGEANTKGGERYNEMSLYDFRHSGACHWRLGAYKTKIDALMYRGGWNNLEMLNYYTKKLGMKDSIEKSDLLVDIDKTELDRQRIDLDQLKENYIELTKNIEEIKKELVKIHERKLKVKK